MSETAESELHETTISVCDIDRLETFEHGVYARLTDCEGKPLEAGFVVRDKIFKVPFVLANDGIVFEHCTFTGVTAKECCFKSCDFIGGNLHGSDIIECRGNGLTMSKCRISGSASFSESVVSDCTISGLSTDSFFRCTMYDCLFESCRFDELDAAGVVAGAVFVDTTSGMSSTDFFDKTSSLDVRSYGFNVLRSNLRSEGAITRAASVAEAAEIVSTTSGMPVQDALENLSARKKYIGGFAVMYMPKGIVYLIDKDSIGGEDFETYIQNKSADIVQKKIGTVLETLRRYYGYTRVEDLKNQHPILFDNDVVLRLGTDTEVIEKLGADLSKGEVPDAGTVPTETMDSILHDVSDDVTSERTAGGGHGKAKLFICCWCRKSEYDLAHADCPSFNSKYCVSDVWSTEAWALDPENACLWI